MLHAFQNLPFLSLSWHTRQFYNRGEGNPDDIGQKGRERSIEHKICRERDGDIYYKKDSHFFLCKIARGTKH